MLFGHDPIRKGGYLLDKKFFGAAVLAVLGALWLTPAAASPAAATPVTASGDLDGGYTYNSVNNGGGNSNAWTINGAGVVPLGANWAVQGNVGYNSITGSAGKISEDNTYGVASGFYAGAMGRVGASVSYASLDATVITADATSYGAFADWYASDRYTLSVRGGAITGTGRVHGFSASVSGGDYFGGQAIVYIQPNLDLSGTIDYVRLPILRTSVQTTVYSLAGEYLVSQTRPLAVTMGYSYATVSVLGFNAAANRFSIGLKYYFGGGGSLEDHQRSGSENWGVGSPVQNIRF